MGDYARITQEEKIKRLTIVISSISLILVFVRILVLSNMMSKMPGANAIFAAAYEIFCVFIILTSYTFSISVNKMVRSRIRHGQIRNAFKVLRSAVVIAIIIGGIMSVLFYFFPEMFARDLMKVSSAAFAVKQLAPALIILCVSGSIRGFLCGFDIEIPCALISVLEQVVVFIVSILGLNYYKAYGAKVSGLLMNEEYNAIYAVKGCMTGVTIGAFVGLCLYIFIYYMNRIKFKKLLRKDTTIRDENYGQVSNIFFRSVLPYAAILLLFVMHTFISQRFLNGHFFQKGNETYAIKYFGMYYMKFRAFIAIPIMLFFMAMKNEEYQILKYAKNNDVKRIREYLQSAVRKILLFALPATCYVMILGSRITGFICNGSQETIEYLMLPGALLIILYSLIFVTTKVLFGMRKLKEIFVVLIVSNALYFISFIFMVRNFNLGIEALLISAIVFALFVLVGNMVFIKRYVGYRQELLYTVFIPYIATFAMGVVFFIIQAVIGTNINPLLVLVVAALIGFVVFWIVIAALKGIQKDELEEIPTGKIAYLLLTKTGFLEEKE